ncbi:hypothetical protein NUW54_g14574 [Trametes sanguinea]|uniref:Uncharacterized protein n=1 Tax=Trametes sanguinea TaxID=158606 RepID=A0ACC1MBF0_9APHY|nr:hypothetical protein NUW54_g14574 [Trametes sanguinea]
MLVRLARRIADHSLSALSMTYTNVPLYPPDGRLGARGDGILRRRVWWSDAGLSPQRRASLAHAPDPAIGAVRTDRPPACISPISAHTGNQGPLLYLCRTSPPSHNHNHGEQQAGSDLPPIWMSCLAQLDTTHVLISWQTAQGNPTSRLVPFTACSDVRSLALSELGAEARALLPEGRPRSSSELCSSSVCVSPHSRGRTEPQCEQRRACAAGLGLLGGVEGMELPLSVCARGADLETIPKASRASVVLRRSNSRCTRCSSVSPNRRSADQRWYGSSESSSTMSETVETELR